MIENQLIEGSYRLLPMQQGMLFHSVLEDGGGVYVAQVVGHLPLNVDLLAFEKAWQCVVDRHAALRTGFYWEGTDNPLQFPLSSVTVVMNVHDLREMAAAEQSAKCERYLADDKKASFDLAKPPLMRFSLFRLAQGEHLFVWTHHHALLDGRARVIVLKEVSDCYTALCRAQDPELPPPVAYRNYVDWYYQQDDTQSRTYWQRLLGEGEASGSLSSLFDDLALHSGEESLEKVIDVPPGLEICLQQVARRNKVTVSMVIQAAWGVLLGRYTGSEDVVFGETRACRRPAFKAASTIVGMMMNTVPIRLRVSSNRTFNELLDDLRGQHVTLREYEHASLADIREWSGTAKTGELFDSIVVFEEYDLDHVLQREGAALWQRGIHRSAPSHYPLVLAGYGKPELSLRLSYDRNKVNDSFADRVVGHLQTLLEGAVRSPKTSIGKLPLLTAAELRQIADWNATQDGYSSSKCIHEWFEEQTDKTPNANALIFEQNRLSYRELNRRANQLAHSLRAMGVGPDDRVAFCVERGFELVVCLLGILKAGGAYVPLDPGYPAERLLYMVEDSAPVALLVEEDHRDDFARLKDRLPILSLNEALATPKDLSDINPGVANIGLTPSHLAYVIYTSGSTGNPKGVMVQHVNVTRLFRATQPWFQFDEKDVWTLFHSYAFDFSVWEIWGALLHGGSLVIVPKCLTRSPEDFYKLLCEARVTILNQTPSAFRQLMSAQAQDQKEHHLRHVIFGGEALEVAMLKPWYARTQNQHTRLINMYGITETTVHVTYRPLEQADTTQCKASPIGKRIPDLTIYILNKSGEPVPVGVLGELYVGGAGVARGYLNRPELTAERFIHDPFSAEPAARMYKTGDLGRWREDGSVEYLGRNDFQVKIRGFRIELGEIEARLAECAGIQDAVVVARADAAGNERLVAYYTCAEMDGTLAVDELRAHLSAKLPEYMVPAAYAQLTSLPLTLNGKLDVKALPDPGTQAYASPGYVAPQGEIENLLAEIWASLLNVEQVGRYDNFFSLGGHSLLALALRDRLRRSGLHLNVGFLFAMPTLASLAPTINRIAGSFEVPPNRIPLGCKTILPEMLPLVRLTQEEIAQIVALVPGGAVNVQDIYPLAPLQEGILFHHLMGGKSDPYLVGFLYSFDRRALLDGYLRGLQQVIDRHDILRTAVLWKGLPEPVQVVWRKATLMIQEVTIDDEDVAGHLYSRYSPREHRIGISQAPLWHIYVSPDQQNNRWLMMQLRHHLVGDQTSVRMLHEEIQAYQLGKGELLPAPQPFRNLVAQARLGISQQEHEDFFRNMLGEISEPTAPFGLVNVQGDGDDVEEGQLLLQEDLARRIRANVRRLGISSATIFHLAWAQVLACVSGHEDVVFGTVLFGRAQGGEGSDRIIGPLINTLPIKISTQGPVEQSVTRTHALLADLMRHEHASLVLAQRCSAVPAPTPLFSALLNYRRSPAGSGTLSEETLWASEGIRILRSEDRTNYPITLSVDDFGEAFGLKAQVEASVNAHRVCQYMETALASLVEALERSPEMPVRGLKVLPAVEREQVLYGWNRTQKEFPAEKCVHELFEEQVARTPGAVALVYEEQQLSYEELNHRANQLAHYVRELGVGPDQRVGICAERSVEMVVALLGVLKAGGAYVPLDPAYPAERLNYMLEDSGAVVLLRQRHVQALFEPGSVGVPVIDLEEVSGWEQQCRANPDRQSTGLSPRHLVYVIYTSGSTGKPKGVMNQHGAVVNRLRWMQEEYELKAGDAVLQKTPYSFDVSVWEFFWPLLAGARLVMARAEGHKDSKYLVKMIEREKITTMHFVPSMLQVFLEEAAGGEEAGAGEEKGGEGGKEQWRLKRVMCSGEALSGTLARRFHERLPGTELHNLYGPTEAAVDVTAWACRLEERGAIPIGRPIANTRIYILDERGEPVPIGVWGELHIGGIQVARGYVGRAELTAERFVPDPYVDGEDAKESGSRMYRTGDLGRWRSDGQIEFLGRNDFQVKVRGFRIELGEIEARLAEHAGIQDAVVLMREDTAGDKRLVAYYTCQEDGITAEELRASLAANLPEYMVPAAYVRLEKLPLTTNGKLDRKALPAPDAEAYATQQYEEPQGEMERKLAEIWAEVLKLERVGRHDNFFALGGHSLLAVRVMTRLRQILGVEVGIRELFAHPVVAELASALEQAKRTELPPITRAERGEYVPLSYAQQRLWFLAQMKGVSEAYHIPFGIRLQGRLDRAALRRALDRIVWRHEALRTTFGYVEEEAVQRIGAAEESRFLLVEEEAGEERLQELIRQEAGAGFDLERGPLIRGRLIGMGEEEHVLLITMHHIVSDGWSLGLLMTELSQLYGAYVKGEEDPLEALEIQYSDYAVWQRRWMGGEVLREQGEYWKKELAGAPEVLELPTDHPRPAQQDYAGGMVGMKLDKKLTAGLKALSQRQGTTLFMTLLAGWAALLGRLSGEKDVLIGTPVANRSRAEIEKLIGFFVNTVVLRVDLRESPKVRELLEQVKERALGGQQNQEIPFEQVVELVQPTRSLGHSALFQVMFAWQNMERSSVDFSEIKVRPLAAGHYGVAKFDLTLSLQEMGEEIEGGVGYAKSLFEEGTVERYAGYYRRVLEGMVEGGEEEVVERLPLLEEVEREQVVYGWNRTEKEFPAEKCVHELFEEQVERSPSAIAVIYEEQQLSYEELNHRANQLAHYLRELGVGPDQRVAICVERGLEMVVGILAVLKAGGAYVPLDPAYPAERLSYMLEDSSSRALLTQTHLREAITELNPALPVVEMTATNPAWKDHPIANPERESTGLSSKNLAYVMYTSGSTGKPKGVMVRHPGIVRLVRNTNYIEIGVTDRVAQASNASFDAATFEIWGALLNGAQLVHVEREELLGAGLREKIEQGKISILFLTTGLFNQLARERGEVFQGLRCLLFGGEQVDGQWVKQVQAKGKPEHFLHVYGPTETVSYASWYEIEEGREEGSIPIGRPIGNTRIYILDEQGEPVPVGVTGEIYISGAGVARGYLNRAELTAERFVPDPYVDGEDAKESGSRMYRTGDLGRWRSDGQIEFLGRNDFQVKVRGFRIELGEIEARLAEHAGIQDAVVLMREDTAGDKRLVAYYTCQEDGITAEELGASLAANLPEYMVPAAYVRLEKLPLTTNGKLDRKALPAPEQDAYSRREYEAPQGETEIRLAQIWAALLNLDNIGRYDHFFKIGGHSLLAIRVISQVRQALSVELSLRDIFASPVLADLAVRIIDLQLEQFDSEEMASVLTLLQSRRKGVGDAV